MQPLDVTPRVWERVLSVNAGTACACCGSWSAGEQATLALYGSLARRDLGPLTVAQIGQSLDGRIATVAGDARDVSGQGGLAHLHRLRALVDGVVIGVGTALHDDPRLTVRLCPGHNPARVVIDPNGRLPDDAPMLRDDGTRRIVIQAVERRRPAGVEVIRLSLGERFFPARTVLQALRKAGLEKILIEGGGITISRFLEARLLNRLHVAVAPLLIGAGPSALTTQRPELKLADCVRPETRVFSLGTDVLFDCALSEDAVKADVPVHGRASAGLQRVHSIGNAARLAGAANLTPET